MLAVAGDSAGGNLAAIATQELRGEVEIAAQLLIYPATDLLGHHPSKDEFGTGHLLTTEMTDYINTLYFSGEAPAPGDWRHSPLHGDLTGLPPAVVATAGCDLLRDEGEAYAAALAAAGVRVDAVRCDGMIHGFMDQGHVSRAAADATARRQPPLRPAAARGRPGTGERATLPTRVRVERPTREVARPRMGRPRAGTGVT